VRVYQAYNDIDEASFIVDEVKMLHSDGWALNDIALLYRSNAQSRVIEHALFSNNIPYRVYGGLRFFERAEIKHAMAYLRLVSNPEDDVALLRVINFPTRGIGARSLEQLQESARAQDCSLWQAAINKVGNGRPGKGIEGFVALIKQMQEDAKGLTLPEMTEIASTMSGLKNFYQGEKEGEDRIANLDELINAAVSFMNNNSDALEDNSNGLTEFLTHASLEAGEHQADVGADALQLMTVHAAKGLEFKAVFISGLEEGLCPHENSLYENNGLEEERRLMYVAVTRARQRLYLSHAQSRMLHGQIRYGIASRFLDEIPEGLLKRLNSRQVQKPSMGNYGNQNYQTTAPSNSSEQKSAMPWKIGQAVSHAKFGQGVVVSYEGNASDMRIQINFGREGLKWLAMEYAKLEKV
jgi:DNA helicase-2/ATP-dependent DNA helicase PcrA